MEAAQSNRTRDKVAHSRVNHHQLLFGNWNILTLTGKELKLVKEVKRYYLDIHIILDLDSKAIYLDKVKQYKISLKIFRYCRSFFNQELRLWNCEPGWRVEALLFWS